MITIKLPDLKQFDSKSKKICPLEKFWEWLALELPHNTELGQVLFGESIYGVPSKYRIDVTKVILNPDDYAKIIAMTTKWAYRVKLKGYSEAYVESAVAMLDLEIGPKKDWKKELGVPEGCVWVENDYLKEYNRYE